MSVFIAKSPYEFKTYDPVLENNSWEDIRKAADKGLAPSLWSVGDKKSVLLQGTAGSLALNGTYYAFILGFDHNAAIEGLNTIHFQFGKTNENIDIAFCDSAWGTAKTSGNWFNMNNAQRNNGGWKSSVMRNTTLPTFKNCMPASLRSSLRSITKYSDNTGGGSNTASYVTATTDDLFLLAEYEAQGVRTYANSAEQNYQKQYEYYTKGNSKVKYQHNSTSTTAGWWLRSVYADNAYYFVVFSEMEILALKVPTFPMASHRASVFD